MGCCQEGGAMPPQKPILIILANAFTLVSMVFGFVKYIN